MLHRGIFSLNKGKADAEHSNYRNERGLPVVELLKPTHFNYQNIQAKTGD